MNYSAMKSVAPKQERTRVSLACFTALHLIQTGNAGIDEWQDLADACNHIEALIDMGKVDASKFGPIVVKAVIGLVQARRNHLATGRMTLSGEQYLLALRECVTEYDSAVNRFSRATIAQAQMYIVIKIARARVGDGTEVVE